MLLSDIYLVHSAKKKIIFNLPITISFFVYAYAKQRMLEFYYDFLLPAVGKDNFELIQMDTDSFYFGCSADTLRDAAQDRDLFDQLAPEFIETCEEDRKKPGLFKPECEATAMVAVCSKTYIAKVDPEDPSKNKISAKGVQRAHNPLAYDQFYRVVQGEEHSVSAVNRGLRMVRRHILMYEQAKDAFSHVYIKRKLLADGIRTEPLDL